MNEIPKLNDLIARLEAATGADRELDVGIYRAEFPFPCVELSQECQDEIDEFKAPHYTSSIDAAMTLLPAGMFWRVEISGGGSWARVWRQGEGTSSNPKRVVAGATGPIALCIASLKANSLAESSTGSRPIIAR